MKKKLRILAIAPQPFFSPRGTPFSVYYRTLMMAEQGTRIDLLTYGEGIDVDLPNTRLIRIPKFARLGPVKTGPSLLKLFLDMFISMWTIGLLIRTRYDVVHAHEEAVFLCRFLKPIFRFKLIYDMHSSLPQQLDNFEFTRSRAIKSVFSWLENSSVSASDAVVTICPDLSDHVENLLGEDGRHILIENSIFCPIRINNHTSNAERSIPQSRSIPDDATVAVYAGTFEHYQGLDLLIEGFAKVGKEFPNLILLMVGGTPEQVEHFSRVASSTGYKDRIIFTGQMDPDVARKLNREADILMSPRSAGTNTPLKIYEQLASGKPLIATRIYSHTQVLTDLTAFLVEPTADGIAAGFRVVLGNPGEASRRATAAKELYRAKYSRDAYKTKIGQLLELVS